MISPSQYLLVNGSGQATRLRANLSTRLAALGHPITVSQWAHTGSLAAGSRRSLSGIWRFNPGGGVDLSWLLSLTSAGNAEWLISTNGTAPGQVASLSTAAITTVVGDEEWFNLIVLADTTDVEFYVNGVKLGATVAVGSDPYGSSVADFNIGADDDGTTRWLGSIGQSAFYDARKAGTWPAANWDQFIDFEDADLVCGYAFEGDLNDGGSDGQALSFEGTVSLANFPVIVGDITAPTITNVTPSTGSQITTTTPITFDVNDETKLDRVIILLRYLGEPIAREIFDGSSFRAEFAKSTSTATDGVQSRSFSLLPTGGWKAEIAELKILANDGELEVFA